MALDLDVDVVQLTEDLVNIESVSGNEQEIADAKSRSRNNVPSYGKGISQETKPFPWLATFLGVTSIIIAAPFALRMFKNMTSEGTRNSFGRGAAREGDDL